MPFHDSREYIPEQKYLVNPLWRIEVEAIPGRSGQTVELVVNLYPVVENGLAFGALPQPIRKVFDDANVDLKLTAVSHGDYEKIGCDTSWAG